MESQRDRTVVRRGIRLLVAKAILGTVAAAAAIAIMRVAGNREILVAVCIGLVPGIMDRSPKKLIFGIIFAILGYAVGARISVALGKLLIEEVPFFHWAITGAFIGMTAGFSSSKGQWFSFRWLIWTLGAAYGFLLGFVFGIMGDIGGFFTIVAPDLPLFYYMREVSLLCAGAFINIGAALATILATSLNNGLFRVARTVENVET
ncbi:MAG: hypothetical protein Kow0099_10120 [Candidatus Abyssubacteria bacterium]